MHSVQTPTVVLAYCVHNPDRCLAEFPYENPEPSSRRDQVCVFTYQPRPARTAQALSMTG